MAQQNRSGVQGGAADPGRLRLPFLDACDDATQTEGAGDLYPHRETHAYRQAIRRKIDAYHRFIQISCIAQGILHSLAVQYPRLVWRHFGSWLRKIRSETTPSEMVTAQALRNGLSVFLSQPGYAISFATFLHDRVDPQYAQDRFRYG